MKKIDEIIYGKIPEILYNDYLIYKKLKEVKNENFVHIIEFSIHSHIVQSDINTLRKNYHSSTDKMEKRLYCRLISIMVHEYTKDINQLLGYKFKTSLEEMGLNEFVEDCQKFNKKFSDFRKEHSNLFINIRNKSGAHKAEDIDILINTIYTIDDKKIISLVDYLLKLNETLLSYVTDVYEKFQDTEKWKKLTFEIQKDW